MSQDVINDAHKTVQAEHSVTVIPAGVAFSRYESNCSHHGTSLRADDGEHPR